jgi:hypothetical protein
MSYAQYGTIAASDYNGLVGAANSTTSGTLNAVWATGGTSAGYGQTAEANVAVGDTVTATKWANLVNKTSNSASHQGTSITAVTAPATGGTVTYLSAIPTNLTSIYTGRLNSATLGSTAANSANRGTTWSNNLVATLTATFANGDAARYFFNSGGQLKLTFSHPTGSTIDNSLNALATACGTVVISAPSSGTITVASVSFNGVTKIGGSGTVNAISNNSGYFGLTPANANVQIFKQLVASAPSGYTNTNININAKTNGTQGSNGDNGSVITIYCQWAELNSTGLTASAGSNSILTVAYPETTYLSNSWGTVTTSASVSGT